LGRASRGSLHTMVAHMLTSYLEAGLVGPARMQAYGIRCVAT
jgi:hypothetical protein